MAPETTTGRSWSAVTSTAAFNEAGARWPRKLKSLNDYEATANLLQ